MAVGGMMRVYKLKFHNTRLSARLFRARERGPRLLLNPTRSIKLDWSAAAWLFQLVH